MALVKWSAFHHLIAPDVFECPSVTIENAVRDAAREFFERTYVWRETMDTVPTRAGIDVYDLEAPMGAVVEDISFILYDGLHFKGVRQDSLPNRWMTASGSPTRFSFENDEQIRIYPAPNHAGQFTVQVVLKPSSTAQGIESRFFEHYRETIAHGAKHRLMVVGGKTWTNPVGAQYHHLQFMRGVNSARIRDDHGVSNRIQPRPFR